MDGIYELIRDFVAVAVDQSRAIVFSVQLHYPLGHDIDGLLPLLIIHLPDRIIVNSPSIHIDWMRSADGQIVIGQELGARRARSQYHCLSPHDELPELLPARYQPEGSRLAIYHEALRSL